MTEHTPGPWFARYAPKGAGEDVWVEDGDENPIADMLNYSYYLRGTDYESIREAVNKSANVRLIAAAPELLEVCKAMIGVVDAVYSGEPCNMFEVHDMLEAVINKAEGRS
jgi:hypothetical protein